MIALTNSVEQSVAVGQPVVLDTVFAKSGCSECHRMTNTSVKLCGHGHYSVSFKANLGTGTALAPVQLAIAIGGEIIPATAMLTTPTNTTDRENVAITFPVSVCCCDFSRISVVNSGVNPVIVNQPMLYIRKEN